ncbi:immunoglobulin gamma-1 heavy chain-like [Aquarana catesbeiana]|uniref:immunoglobulin gamma-1 heavy chain-like n=1 Tax=Aquarana catesbeiana TaxID=8400 RepID=UPI003CC9EC2A
MSWSVLFITSLLFYTNCSAQYSVTQPAAQSVSPGNTVTLTCTVTGFSVGDRYVYWYQQKTGDRPRYLLRYKSDSDKHQGAGVPDRFSGSKDTPKNTGYLTIKSVMLEDEADYYCGVWHPTISGLFIFGSGTSLAVNTGEVKAPSVFIYPPSAEELEATSATLVCTASDYKPKTATTEWLVDGRAWTAGVYTSQIVKQSDNSYMGSTFLTMTSSVYNTHHEYSCKVKHEGQEYVKTLKRSESHSGEVKAPSVFIYPPSAQEIEAKSATLVCTASDYKPKTATTEWLVDGRAWTAGVYTSQIVKQSDNSYMGSTFLTMTSSVYNTHDEYSCKVKHEAGEVKAPSVFIYPPSAQELEAKSATLVCTVSDYKPKTATTEWLVDGRAWTAGVYTSQIVKQSSPSLWFVFGGGTQLIVNTGEVKAPVVLFFGPSKEELENATATLVCTASDYKPRTATMEFLVDGQTWKNGVSTSPITKQSDSSYMESSFLTMTSDDYCKYKEYGCKVRHQGKEFIQTLTRSECF